MQKPSVVWTPSPNFNDRPDSTAPDMIVIHYTGMETGALALDRLCDPAAAVSAHYLIFEDGQIHQLVKDCHRAWHAGISCWRGRDNINHYSIGIELVNTGHDPFPDSQMQALVGLCGYLITAYSIPAYNIVGHSDIAPTRKTDPGPLFDWQKLSLNGIGHYPTEIPKHIEPITKEHQRQMLSDIGYSLLCEDSSQRPNSAAAVSFDEALAAFYLRWNSGNNSENNRGQNSLEILKAVWQLYL